MTVETSLMDLSSLASMPVSKDSPVPLYAQVQEILSNYILENNLPDGAEFPTEAQLCEIFQVSRITTKRALDELVREGMIRRVKGVGNFIVLPNEECIRETCHYGLIADSGFDLFSNNFYSKVFQGIYDTVTLEGGSLVFALSDHALEEAQQLSSMLRSRNISGLLALGSLDEKTLAILRDQRIPTVLVDDDHPGFNRVVTDNMYGAEQAVDCLLRKGHQRIGLVDSCRTSSFRLRTEGFHRAMRRAGLDVRSEWTRSVETFEFDAGHDQFLEILSQPRDKRPTAIFSVNDHFAMNGIRAAEKLGLTVPDDLSIIGFDDTPYATMSKPNLTTIRVQMRRMGELAVDSLKRMLDLRRCDVECRVLSTELIERDTVCHVSA